jgi:hypothetical protein
MLSPEPARPEQGEAMAPSSYQSPRAWRIATVARSPTLALLVLLVVAGRGCSHRTGRVAGGARPVDCPRRCRVLAPRRQRRPSGRRRLVSESQFVGSAPLGVKAPVRHWERARGMDCCSVGAAVGAGSVAEALRLLNTGAVQGRRSEPCQQRHLGGRGAVAGEL